MKRDGHEALPGPGRPYIYQIIEILDVILYLVLLFDCMSSPNATSMFLTFDCLGTLNCRHRVHKMSTKSWSPFTSTIRNRRNDLAIQFTSKSSSLVWSLFIKKFRANTHRKSCEEGIFQTCRIQLDFCQSFYLLRMRSSYKKGPVSNVDKVEEICRKLKLIQILIKLEIIS